MTTTAKTEERASTAKQIARSSQEDQLTMDDIAVCYKILTGIDPEDIIDANQDRLDGHPELQRIRISRTTDTLIRHAVKLSNLILEYRDQIIDEDAELVMSFVNGDTNFCPDHSQLMSVLSQYGIVLRKGKRKGTWIETTYGGLDFERFFDKKSFSKTITQHIRCIEKDADKMEHVRKIHLVEFARSPYVFCLWTDKHNVRYISYARYDWGKVRPLGYKAEEMF